MLTILILSSIGPIRSFLDWRTPASKSSRVAAIRSKGASIAAANIQKKGQADVLFRLAVPQLLLAISAFTTYHVQIISRLASAYPVWYMWIAALLIERQKVTPGVAKGMVRFMVIYGLVQGGLFASFMPPA
jgi:phosphatidylinositol glycan class V